MTCCLRLIPALSLALLLAFPGVSHAIAEEPQGWLSDVNNTIVLDVSTSVASVLSGDRVNGTLAFVVLTNAPFDDHFRLQAPDGSLLEPVRSFNGRATFQEVPVFKTGEWKVIDSLLMEISRFFTQTQGLPERGASVIDDAVRQVAEKDYWAGREYASNDRISCEPEGYPYPERYDALASKSVRVYADWNSHVEPQPDAPRTAIFSITATGDVGSRTTSYAVAAPDRGKVSTMVDWTALRVYEVTLTVELLGKEDVTILRSKCPLTVFPQV